MPRPLFTPGKDPVPIVQEVGWDPGPVWTGAENLAPTGIRSPDRPARSQSLCRLSYLAHLFTVTNLIFWRSILTLHTYLCVVPSNRHFRSDFPTKIPQAFVICAMQARCSSPCIPLHLITLQTWSSTSCDSSTPHPPTLLLLPPPLERTLSSALCSPRLELHTLTSITENNFYLCHPFALDLWQIAVNTITRRYIISCDNIFRLNRVICRPNDIQHMTGIFFNNCYLQ